MRLVAPMTRMFAGVAVGLRRRLPSGSQPLTHSTTLPRMRTDHGVCSSHR